MFAFACAPISLSNQGQPVATAITLANANAHISHTFARAGVMVVATGPLMPHRIFENLHLRVR